MRNQIRFRKGPFSVLSESIGNLQTRHFPNETKLNFRSKCI